MSGNDDLAFAPTLVDSSSSTTVPGSTPTRTDEPPKPGAMTETSFRTHAPSVLPRVDLVDGQPALIREERPRFEVVEKLGEGGVGEVLRARDADIGRDVAIKRLRRHADSNTSLARFAEEMRVTGSLDHPNVIPVHDVGVDPDGEYFFVMRHVRGETLEDIIERLAAGDPETHETYGVERRIEIFSKILSAISYAHAQGIVHRDIKPANIMVGPFGEVVVMDWGIAKPIAHAGDLATLGDAPGVADDEGLERAFETQAGGLVGTPAYMAPEQVRGLAVDRRTDIYALCVLLHEMLFLRHYLADQTNLVGICNGVANTRIAHDMRTGNPLQPIVPADMLWFIEKGMEKDPDDRYQSVDEMIERLGRRQEGEVAVQCAFMFTRASLAGLLRFYDRYPIAFFVSFAATVIAILALIIIGFVT